MSSVVEIWGENGRAERLIGEASDGSIEVYVLWCSLGNEVLFTLRGGKAPTAPGLAAMTEIAERFTSNSEFREAVEAHCISVGAAVHGVDKPAWKFKALGAQ